jgi:hypothetical protein
MYGRADGMPSFQLTVAVCALFANLYNHNPFFVISEAESIRPSQDAPPPNFVLLIH